MDEIAMIEQRIRFQSKLKCYNSGGLGRGSLQKTKRSRRPAMTRVAIGGVSALFSSPKICVELTGYCET